MQNNFSEEEVLELIEKAKLGNTRAFELIIRSYQRYGFAVAFKILCNEDDTKDVVQETFIRIWKHIGNYDKKIKFTTWMYKIVVNLCYDKLKSQKRRKKFFDKLEEEAPAINNLRTVDIEKEFSNKEFAGIIKHLANGLSEKQRMVFILRDMEELSIEETAEILDTTENSVKANLFFARKNIREKIIELEK